MMTTYVVMSVALSLKNHCFFIVAVPLALWRIYQWFLHRSRPWRRMHFPMMRVHAAAAAEEQVDAVHEKREWDIKNVLASMVATARPEWPPPRIEIFITQELAKIEAFHDRPLVKQYILKKNPHTDESKVDEYLDDIYSILPMTHNGLLTRAIIAGLVEEEYGKEHKGEYLYALFTNKAI